MWNTPKIKTRNVSITLSLVRRGWGRIELAISTPGKPGWLALPTFSTFICCQEATVTKQTRRSGLAYRKATIRARMGAKGQWEENGRDKASRSNRSRHSSGQEWGQIPVLASSPQLGINTWHPELTGAELYFGSQFQSVMGWPQGRHRKAEGPGGEELLTSW